MNRCFSVCLLASFLSLFCQNSHGDINHAKFQAQQAALSALEGPTPFTLRESWLKGRLAPEQAKLVPQQLFNKNDYQFWFAVPDINTAVLLNIYDQEGRLLEADTVRYLPKKNVVSLIFSPKKSGLYYLRLALDKETEGSHDWALIYAYR